MHAQEDILGQILGAPAVLNRSRDEGEHEVLVAINQFAERIVVARAAPFDECSLGGRIHPPAY